MGSEMKKLIMVWVLVYVSVYYCYVVSKIFPKGRSRLITILPVVCLFIVLPCNLNSIHPGGITFFFITFLGSLKFLLLAYGIGPLSDPSLSLPHFIAVACLPIKIQQDPPPLSHKHLRSTQNKGEPPNGLKKWSTSRKGHVSFLNYATKAVIWALLVRRHDYLEKLHPKVSRFILFQHIYIYLEVILGSAVVLAQALLGLKLEPQFDKPYLSTSLQNFWGRRWNLMVRDILHSAVYKPVLHLSKPILGHKWAFVLSIMSTFLVSGLLHELALYNMGRFTPTWGNLCFFLLHGFCLIVEIILKKKFSGMFRLPPVMSGPLTMAFVTITFSRLAIPEILLPGRREQGLEELAILGSFVKHLPQTFTFFF